MTCPHKLYEFVGEYTEIGDCPRENCMAVVLSFVCSDCGRTGTIERINHVCDIIWREDS